MKEMKIKKKNNLTMEKGKKEENIFLNIETVILRSVNGKVS